MSQELERILNDLNSLSSDEMEQVVIGIHHQLVSRSRTPLQVVMLVVGALAKVTKDDRTGVPYEIPVDIVAQQSDLRLASFEDKPVQLVIRRSTISGVPTPYVYLLGGPTGYESLSLDDMLDCVRRGSSWQACGGTPGRYRAMIVPHAELLVAAKQWGYDR